MAQLTLPNSIDAGTPVAAAEVQGNFVAIRDLINGNLEGGAGNNFKANGITARELFDTVLPNAGWHSAVQAGVLNAGDYKVTPGAGLVLNWAAGGAQVLDSTGIITGLLGLVPVVSLAGSTVTVTANASGNPRIDQVVLTMTAWYTGTVSVVAGTPTGGATLDNRSGAAALPANSIRLADILMPNGFAGPFVQNTHIRDRRPWARGINYSEVYTSGNVQTTGTSFGAGAGLFNAHRFETSGAPVQVGLAGMWSNSSAPQSMTLAANLDGASVPLIGDQTVTMRTANDFFALHATVHISASAGSHVLGFKFFVSGGTGTVYANVNFPLHFWVREFPAQNTQNSGA